MNEVLYEESAEPRNIKTQKAFFDYFAGLVNTRAFSCEKVRAYMQEEKND